MSAQGLAGPRVLRRLARPYTPVWTARMSFNKKAKAAALKQALAAAVSDKVAAGLKLATMQSFMGRDEFARWCPGSCQVPLAEAELLIAGQLTAPNGLTRLQSICATLWPTTYWNWGSPVSWRWRDGAPADPRSLRHLYGW